VKPNVVLAFQNAILTCKNKVINDLNGSGEEELNWATCLLLHHDCLRSDLPAARSPGQIAPDLVSGGAD
jgi:hypothetical protein